jgi:hypothetical protein
MATQAEKSTALAGQPRLAAPSAPHNNIGHLLLPASAKLPPAQRLVVLVPAGLSDESALAQHIWTLAQPRGLAVLFVGCVPRVEDEPALRRRLVLLAALTRDTDSVHADFRLSIGTDWIAPLRALGRPGDLVVCHAEQCAPWLAFGQPLERVLAGTLGRPVYRLSGYCQPEVSEAGRLARQAVFWIGALAVVASFFWIQVNVQRMTRDWMQTAVFIFTVLVEFALLAAWNRWLT